MEKKSYPTNQLASLKFVLAKKSVLMKINPYENLLETLCYLRLHSFCLAAVNINEKPYDNNKVQR